MQFRLAAGLADLSLPPWIILLGHSMIHINIQTTVDAVCRTGGLGSRCQEVARQTCTVAFEGRQVMCFEITVGPCEFAAWVTYWWYDPFIFNTLDTYCLPQVLLTQANPLAEVSQLLPSRLHSNQQTYTMFWTFFFSPFAKGTAERVREKSWIRREHTEMARAVLAAELCVLHSLHPYTEGEAISSPNLH